MPAVKKRVVKKSVKENTNLSKEIPTDLDSALEEIRKEIETNGLNIKPEEVPMAEEATTEDAPKKKPAAKKPAAKKPAAKKAPAKAPVKGPQIGEGYKIAQVAAEFEMDACLVRKLLRGAKIAKPEAGWIWKNKSDPKLKEIRDVIKAYIKENTGRNPAGAKSAVKAQEKVKKEQAAARKTAAKKAPAKKPAPKKAPAKKKAAAKG